MLTMKETYKQARLELRNSEIGRMLEAAGWRIATDCCVATYELQRGLMVYWMSGMDDRSEFDFSRVYVTASTVAELESGRGGFNTIITGVAPSVAMEAVALANINKQATTVETVRIVCSNTLRILQINPATGEVDA